MNLWRVVIILIVLAIGCNNEPAGPQIDPKAPSFSVVDACLDTATSVKLIPLNKGNYWVYDFEQYDEAGNLDSSQRNYSREITGAVTYGGVEWFVLRTSDTARIGDRINFDVQYVRNCLNGYCKNGQLMFKFIRWEEYYDYQGMPVTLSQRSYALSLPSGEFRLRRYEMNDTTSGLIWHYYVDEKVGRVKTDALKVNPDRVWRSWNLVDFHVK